MPDSIQKWIDAAYDLLAAEGPEGLQIEKLARILGLNKSGFYHHFGDRDVFLSTLMEHHIKMNNNFCSEIARARNFNPELIQLSIKYKDAVLVQMHLRKHSDNTLFRETFTAASRRNEKYIIPLWAEYLKIPDKYSLALELYDIFRDVLFIRITSPARFEEEVNMVAELFSRLVSTFLRHEHLITSKLKESRL